MARDRRLSGSVGALLAAIAFAAYVYLLAGARAAGERMAANPEAQYLAGWARPETDRPPQGAVSVSRVNRWWTPPSGRTGGRVEFGGIIRNTSGETLFGLRAVVRARDREGRLSGEVIVPCIPAEVAPGDEAEYRGSLTPWGEVLALDTFHVVDKERPRG